MTQLVHQVHVQEVVEQDALKLVVQIALVVEDVKAAAVVLVRLILVRDAQMIAMEVAITTAVAQIVEQLAVVIPLVPGTATGLVNQGVNLPAMIVLAVILVGLLLPVLEDAVVFALLNVIMSAHLCVISMDVPQTALPPVHQDALLVA